MKQRIRVKIFKNRWRLKYTLGQIFAVSRGTVFWVFPGNGYEYYLNYHNGKIGKEKIDSPPMFDKDFFANPFYGIPIKSNEKIVFIGV